MGQENFELIKTTQNQTSLSTSSLMKILSKWNTWSVCVCVCVCVCVFYTFYVKKSKCCD